MPKFAACHDSSIYATGRTAALLAVLALSTCPAAAFERECSYEHGGDVLHCFNGQATHANDGTRHYASAGAVSDLYEHGCARPAWTYRMHASDYPDGDTVLLATLARWPKLHRFYASLVIPRGGDFIDLTTRDLNGLGVRTCKGGNR